ncbi:MAG: zinc ABC transporter substrate-binding protein [Planctomycetes bacterium]|nr:zinc ABC transporter substrate-binding protein [Planctomycetota bacterium]
MALSSSSLAAAALVALAPFAVAQHAVVATTPDLAAICRVVGGDRVAVSCLVRGPQDPHFVEARPSLLRVVQQAELLVEVGRELEIGWLEVLVGNARNGVVLSGQPGRFDASSAVRALGVPAAGTDRAAGDVHAGGNPHYMLDPLCGLQVARALRDKFAATWPRDSDGFAERFERFRRDLAVAMVGAKVAERYGHDAEKLAVAFGNGTLRGLLHEHGDLDQLGGWFAALAPLRGAKLIADHDLWPYFCERCGVEVVGTLEPKPGVPPSTSHLQTIVELVRTGRVGAIVTAPYFPPQHAAFVAKATGVRIAELGHQCGARPGTDDYLDFVDGNVRALVAALAPLTVSR